MYGIIAGILVFVIAVVFFGWLTVKAGKAHSVWVKLLGILFSGVFTIIFALLALVSAIGFYKLYRSNTVAVTNVTVTGTPDQIARGEHLAQVLCASCHSLNDGLPLSGGENLSADAGLPLGDIYAPNLTPATDIKDWQDGDLFRVIRTGVDDEGRATAMTSVVGVHALSDDDILSVIAYLRQSPAVENETPEFKPTVLMAIFAGASLIPMDVPAAVSAVSAPPAASTSEYGKYVFTYMDCASCHGVKLDGAVPPPYPAGPDIRKYFSHWSKNDFLNVVHAYAVAAQPGDVMPWKDISRMNDVELEALYLYLHEVTNK